MQKDLNLLLTIDRWYGRLGNNIIQLHNAILIGLYYNCNISIPPHNFFNKQYIKINDKIDSIIYKHEFYYTNDIIIDCNNINVNLFNINKEESLNLLNECFTINGNDINPLNDNDLVIHIRSGDIFRDNPHIGYAQYPLSFYTNLINENNFDNIILVAEDNKNPCINELLKMFPNIKHTINTLEDDIKIILSAKQIVASNGTFIPQLLKFSQNINKVYNYKSNDEYNKLIYPWKNTQEQRMIMLTFNIK